MSSLICATGDLEDLETLVEKSYASSRLPEEAATGEGGSFDKCPLLEIKNLRGFAGFRPKRNQTNQTNQSAVRDDSGADANGH